MFMEVYIWGLISFADNGVNEWWKTILQFISDGFGRMHHSVTLLCRVGWQDPRPHHTHRWVAVRNHQGERGRREAIAVEVNYSKLSLLKMTREKADWFCPWLWDNAVLSLEVLRRFIKWFLQVVSASSCKDTTTDILENIQVRTFLCPQSLNQGNCLSNRLHFSKSASNDLLCIPIVKCTPFL